MRARRFWAVIGSMALVAGVAAPSDAIVSTTPLGTPTKMAALGDSITIAYDTDNAARRHRPLQIDYTVSNAGAARYRILFQYPGTDRSDPVSEILPAGSSGGGGQLETRLLDKLLLQHDGTTYREYRFAYAVGAGTNSRLTSVTECVPTDDCLPANEVRRCACMR